MALIKVKPTSPGRRSLIRLSIRTCTRASPMRLCWFHRNVALAATTTATSRRRPGAAVTSINTGIVDFRRNGTVSRPRWSVWNMIQNRSAFIALVLHADGERRYVLAPKA